MYIFIVTVRRKFKYFYPSTCNSFYLSFNITYYYNIITIILHIIIKSVLSAETPSASLPISKGNAVFEIVSHFKFAK